VRPVRRPSTHRRQVAPLGPHCLQPDAVQVTAVLLRIGAVFGLPHDPAPHGPPPGAPPQSACAHGRNARAIPRTDSDYAVSARSPQRN
jgi:hypothetical protein